MNVYKEIGERIRRARESRELSQYDLARILGYTQTAINYYEKGKRKIGIDDIQRLAVVLNKPIEYFVSNDDRLRASPDVNDILADLKMKVLPVVASVPAGKPIMVQENITEYLAIPETFARSADFLIQVKGDSMIEKGILDGDYLLIRRQDTAENGDIVVAEVGDEFEATIKTFYKENDCIRLEPANDKYECLRERDVKIVGKVVGSYRKY